ncbi:hypothetical protein TNCV_1334191 [Trichonephila clavipes]|nr:hypothetical protein TNCV_1334191 [Trichonephila clavipes]
MPSRGPYRQLNDFERGRIFGKREAWWSYRAIGRHLEPTPRCPNERQDRVIVRKAGTVSTVSLSTIQCTTAFSTSPMAPSTISRRLAERGLRLRRPLRRRPLTPKHRRNRRESYHSRSLQFPSD